MAFRPALRPGAPLLRRDATHLQVGTSPGIVVDDRPGLLMLLRLMDGARDVERLEALAAERVPEIAGQVAPLLAELLALGAVVDTSRTSAVPRRRSSYRLALEGDPGTQALLGPACAVLATTGLRTIQSPDPDLLVIASCGESPRAVFERSTQLGIHHLPVVLDEDRVRVGPLVRPGHTPCVTCHDLHRAAWDRAWPALLQQLGHGAARPSHPAVDPLTLQAAALELAAEVLTHADGRPGRTAGRCLVIGPGHDDRTSWPVAFHHACACDLLNAA